MSVGFYCVRVNPQGQRWRHANRISGSVEPEWSARSWATWQAALIFALLVLLGTGAAGCGGAASSAGPPQGAAPTLPPASPSAPAPPQSPPPSEPPAPPQSPPPSTPLLPGFAHVFIVMLENQDYSVVIGSQSMPYFNTLANTYGLATNYFANTHPSIGNYFMLTTGQIITNDLDFSGVVTEDNLVRRLVSAGKTWKAYIEDLPSVGFLGRLSGQPYQKRHNPFAYFSDVVNDPVQQANLVPLPQLAEDLARDQLPSFAYVLPNRFHSSHDCPDGARSCTLDERLASSDRWLQETIEPVLASASFQRDGLLLALHEEADKDNTNGGGKVAVVVVSPKAKRGCQSTTFYQHESVLRLTLEALGLSVLPGAAATAPSMDEFFAQ